MKWGLSVVGKWNDGRGNLGTSEEDKGKIIFYEVFYFR